MFNSIARTMFALTILASIALNPLDRSLAQKIRPTLTVIIPGASQSGRGGRDVPSWADPMATTIGNELSAYGSDNESMIVEWPSWYDNREASSYVADQIRSKVAAYDGEVDVLVVGHSRGAILANDVMKDVGTDSNIGYSQVIMLDPTASRIMGDQYPNHMANGVDQSFRYDDDRRFETEELPIKTWNPWVDEKLKHTRDGDDIDGAGNFSVNAETLQSMNQDDLTQMAAQRGFDVTDMQEQARVEAFNEQHNTTFTSEQAILDSIVDTHNQQNNTTFGTVQEILNSMSAEEQEAFMAALPAQNSDRIDEIYKQDLVDSLAWGDMPGSTGASHQELPDWYTEGQLQRDIDAFVDAKEGHDVEHLPEDSPDRGEVRQTETVNTPKTNEEKAGINDAIQAGIDTAREVGRFAEDVQRESKPFVEPVTDATQRLNDSKEVENVGKGFENLREETEDFLQRQRNRAQEEYEKFERDPAGYLKDGLAHGEKSLRDGANNLEEKIRESGPRLEEGVRKAGRDAETAVREGLEGAANRTAEGVSKNWEEIRSDPLGYVKKGFRNTETRVRDGAAAAENEIRNAAAGAEKRVREIGRQADSKVRDWGKHWDRRANQTGEHAVNMAGRAGKHVENRANFYANRAEEGVKDWAGGAEERFKNSVRETADRAGIEKLTHNKHVNDEIRKAAGDTARETHRFAGDVARESKHFAGDTAREGKSAAGKVSRETKRIVADASREAKIATGKSVRETKRVFADSSRQTKRAARDVAREGRMFAGNAARESKRFLGDASREVKHAPEAVRRTFAQPRETASRARSRASDALAAGERATGGAASRGRDRVFAHAGRVKDNAASQLQQTRQKTFQGLATVDRNAGRHATRARDRVFAGASKFEQNAGNQLVRARERVFSSGRTFEQNLGRTFGAGRDRVFAGLNPGARPSGRPWSQGRDRVTDWGRQQHSGASDWWNANRPNTGNLSNSFGNGPGSFGWPNQLPAPRNSFVPSWKPQNTLPAWKPPSQISQWNPTTNIPSWKPFNPTPPRPVTQGAQQFGGYASNKGQQLGGYAAQKGQQFGGYVSGKSKQAGNYISNRTAPIGNAISNGGKAVSNFFGGF